MSESVSIIGGSGALGFGLALRMACAGVPVAIGSRDAARAAQAADRLRESVPSAQVQGYDNREAAARSRFVVVCVPFLSQASTLKSIGDALEPGTVVVDATVPLAAAVGGKPTRMLGVWQGSAAEQAQELVPEGVKVVSALHTVSAEKLSQLDHEFQEDVLVAGDDRAEKQRVIAMLELVPGLRGVDCGRLEQSRVIESLTALLIGVNIRHKVHAGIRLSGF